MDERFQLHQICLSQMVFELGYLSVDLMEKWFTFVYLDCWPGIGYCVSSWRCILLRCRPAHIFHFCQIWDIYFFGPRWSFCRCICSLLHIYNTILETHFWFIKETDAMGQYLSQNCIRLEWRLNFWDCWKMLSHTQIKN